MVIITVSYLLYCGLLADVTVATGPPPVKKVTLAYKYRRGHYRNCWELSPIALFHDDPAKVKHRSNDIPPRVSGWFSLFFFFFKFLKLM